MFHHSLPPQSIRFLFQINQSRFLYSGGNNQGGKQISLGNLIVIELSTRPWANEFLSTFLPINLVLWRCLHQKTTRSISWNSVRSALEAAWHCTSVRSHRERLLAFCALIADRPGEAKDFILLGLVLYTLRLVWFSKRIYDFQKYTNY